MGCASKAPRLRIATATEAQLREANEAKETWYFFQKGDVVPFVPSFYGAGMGAPESAVPIQAQRDFYLVFRRNLPVMLSLDGKRRFEPGSTLLLVTPSASGRGGQVNWISFIGRPADAEKELEALMTRAQ